MMMMILVLQIAFA